MSHIQAKDFYKPTPYNQDTKNQIWLSQIGDSHDNFCHCNTPFAHLLASIFPVGHKDRTLTIDQILLRDYRQLCLSGGEDAEGTGGAATEIKEEQDGQKEEEDDQDIEEKLDALLAEAAENAER